MAFSCIFHLKNAIILILIDIRANNLANFLSKRKYKQNLLIVTFKCLYITLLSLGICLYITLLSLGISGNKSRRVIYK